METMLLGCWNDFIFPLCHYAIRKRFDWAVVNVYVEQLRRAKVEEWEIPHADSGRPYRRAADMVSPR